MLGLTSQTWSGLDITPVVYIYGNRTTHTDIMCTTNTTKTQQDTVAADPSFLPTVMKFKLPYEVSELFIVADRYITGHKTALEEQQDTSSRIKHNRLLRREQKAFSKRLLMDRMERFNKESSASVKIQSSYRGHMTRLRLRMEKDKINYDSLSVVQEYRIRAKGRRRPLLKFDGCAVPDFYKQLSTEIALMAIELGLPPIEGYTLNQHPNNTRARGRQAIEHFSATNIGRIARGYLARKCSAIKTEDRYERTEVPVQGPAKFSNHHPTFCEVEIQKNDTSAASGSQGSNVCQPVQEPGLNLLEKDETLTVSLLVDPKVKVI